MFEGKACLRSSCLSWCATCSPAQCPIRPQITHFFNESHNSWYWAISVSLSSPSFQQTEHFTKYGCFQFECLAYSSTMRLSMMWRWWRQWPTAANGNPHPSQYQQYQLHTTTTIITILVDTFDALYNSDFHEQHDNDGNTFQMFRGGSVAITKLQRYTRWCASIWLNGQPKCDTLKEEGFFETQIATKVLAAFPGEKIAPSGSSQASHCNTGIHSYTHV